MIDFSLDEALRRWANRMQLAESDSEGLRTLPFNLRTIDRDGFIVREGGKPTSCNILLAGGAFRQKVVHNGARQIISFHFPGEFIDLQACLLAVNDHSVQAMTACKLATVPKDALLALADRRPAIAHALWYDTLVEGAIFREWVVNVGRRPARQRIAHVLCELGSRLDALGLAPRDGYQLPMTQEELGDAVGLTPVHVSRTLKELAAEGLIVRNRRSVSFPSWQAIREAGDLNERYLHLEPQVSAQ